VSAAVMTTRRAWLTMALAVGITLALGPGPGAVAEAQELRTFKFASVGAKPTSVSELYYGLGMEKGWYKEAGVDFQVVRMNATVAYPAMVAGEVDGALYGASAAVAALRGAPLVAVFYDPVSAPWSLVVDPKKIKTPKDLAGARCVAATGAKTATHIAWAAMIESIGGDPRSFQAVGLAQPPPMWLEALRAGTAECMLGFDAAWTGQAVREGFKTLAYLPKVRPIQANGLSVAQASVKDPKKREVVKDVIGVFLRAQEYVKSKDNRRELADTVRRWMGDPKGLQTEDYEAAVAELAALLPAKGYIEDESILGNMLASAIKYDIYDVKEFKQDPRTVDLVKAGVIDQSLVKEAAAWGPPLYRRR
jgi:hypothetical protein